jgi:hypothetical protein
MLPSVYLAAEDEPGLAVGRKLVAATPPLYVYREDNARGYGRLKTKTPNFHQMGSNGLPVLMITDLAAHACPSSMISEWLGKVPSAGFLFRICVREVEAWLLAHRSALADFLTVPLSRFPAAPESVPDPKAELIALAQHSSHRKIRAGFKPIGSSAIGPDYNRLLGDFIRDFWNADIAATVSPSLRRARERLRVLATTIDVLPPSPN